MSSLPVDMISIRGLERRDHASWLPLWHENMEHQAAEEITQNSWAAICDRKRDVWGLGVFVAAGDDNGNGNDTKYLAGILHYILHPTTGSLRPVCYMQDLFIAPDYRRRGLARHLVKALAQKGKDEDWERIYWLAEDNNQGAQALYKDIGVRLDFSLHILPLQLLKNKS